MLSALAILLCVSMLVGSTFAWFTDSVESAKNKIVAGNLDVELYYADSAEPEDENDWKKVTNTTDVFGYDNWEPGFTKVVYFKIVNEGSLALKYTLAADVTNEEPGTNKDGKEFLLSDYMYAAVVGKDVTRDQVQKMHGNNFKNSFAIGGGGSLKAGESAVVGFALWMPTAVDNVANHDGVDVPFIEFGINLFATQYTHESDSYDNLYDENSAVFTVKDANDLMNKNKDKDVALVNCYDPAGILNVPEDYTGTLTIVNSTVKSVYGKKDVNLVIGGNVVVDASYEAPTTFAAEQPAFDGSAITANGKLTISGNGHLTAVAADVKGAFGIGGMNTTDISIKDVNIDYVSGAFVGQKGNDTKYYKDAPEGGAAIGSGYDGAEIDLDNVTIIKALGGSKAAGIGARYHVGVTVSIKDSTIGYVEGGVSAAGIGGSRVSGEAKESGTTISIVNSTVNAKGGAYGAGIGSGYDTHCLAKQPLCTINIEDSNITATGGQYAAGVGTGYHNAALAGEIKNSTVNATSGEKVYKATYTAAMEVGFGVVDPSREGQQTDSYIIYNGNKIDLNKAPDIVEPSETLSINNGDTLVLLSGDYKLPSLSGKKNVTIIGAADGSTKVAAVNSYNFGENTVIKNITFKTSGANSVRYGTTSGDVVYENCVFEGRQYGYHVDNANGGTITFNNCTFYGRNALAKSGTYTFNGCTFKYTYSNYNTTNIYSKAAFNNCKWDSKLELYIDDGAKAVIDGDEITERVVFISDARALESFQQYVNWQNKSYAGVTVMLSADIDMKDAYYAKWTPIGQTGATQFQGTFDGHGYTIKNLNVDATKQTGGHYSSGLFGWLNNATVKNLTVVNATVKGNHNVGVIAGYMETSGCTISNCHVVGATVVANHANGDACGDKVGVIVGHAGNAGVKVENCSAKDSTVSAGRDAGQIVGAALTANVTGCEAENVTVTANGQCTGENVNNAIIGRVLG